VCASSRIPAPIAVIGFAVLLLAALTSAGAAVGSYDRGLRHSGKNTDAAWSPDGRKIAYRGSDGIYVMKADGSNRRRLTRSWGDQQPAWSPDGRKLAFLRLLEADIYVINADGTNLRRLTHNGGERPTWSPNGRKIAFYSNRTGHFEVYVMNTDGSNQRQLTK
jgi:Tol biopolymer transport system component